MRSLKYLDNIKYREHIIEISSRGKSIEHNEYMNTVYGVRVLKNNCLSIASSTTINDFNKLYETALLNTSYCVSRVEWYNDKYYSGHIKIGKESNCSSLREIVLYANRVFQEKGLNSEVIGVCKRISKEITVKTINVEAEEHRILYELYLYPYTLYMGRLISSGAIIAGNSIDEIWKYVEESIHNLVNNIVGQARAKSFNPAYTGRWHVVLTGDASAAFFHEIAHLLKANEYLRLPLGYRFNEKVTVIEDPFHKGPLQRVFDDEVYPSSRRILIEDGVVVDYMHTRTTCSRECRPGNARGLFTISTPFYTQLIVKRGDWSIDEMLFESRRSIVVNSISEAQIWRSYIRLLPENSWIAYKDKLEPVYVNEVLIPIQKLNEVIIGLGRNINRRYGFEKNHEIYEETPSVLIEARISI